MTFFVHLPFVRTDSPYQRSSGVATWRLIIVRLLLALTTELYVQMYDSADCMPVVQTVQCTSPVTTT